MHVVRLITLCERLYRVKVTLIIRWSLQEQQLRSGDSHSSAKQKQNKKKTKKKRAHGSARRRSFLGYSPVTKNLSFVNFPINIRAMNNHTTFNLRWATF